MKRQYPIQPFAGLDKSRPEHEIALNATPDCSGLWPNDGRLERIPGKVKYAPTQLEGDAVLCQRLFIDNAGTRHLVAITNKKAYHYLLSAYTSIQDENDFTANADGPMAACTHFDSTGQEMFVIFNLLDAPRKWTGSGALQELGGTPPKAKMVLPFKGYLLLGHVIESGNADPRKVRYSALFNGENYPAENNFRLKSTTDWLVAMRLMRDRAVIYKENSISMLDYVGGGLIFDLVENYKNGIGPASDSAIVEWGERGERHFFIGQNTNIYEFDGIDDNNVSRRISGILSNISPSKKQLISGVAYPSEGKIIWAIPMGSATGCSDLVIFDVLDRTWWMKYAEPIAINSFGNSKTETSYTWDTLPYPSWDQWSLPGGWDSRRVQANEPEILIGCADGHIRKFAFGRDDDGQAIPSWYLTPFDNLDGSDDTEKVINRVYVEIRSQGTGEIKLNVYTNSNLEAPAVLDDSGNTVKNIPIQGAMMGQGYKTIAIDIFARGTNIAVKLSSASLNWSGKIKGYEYEISGENVLSEQDAVAGLPYTLPFAAA